MEVLELYEKNANNWEKSLQLRIRGYCYAKFYFPKLIEWGIFENVFNVTEIGSGMGDKLRVTQKKLEKFKIKVMGIEASEAMIKKAVDKYPFLSGVIQKENALRLDCLKDESSDILMYFQVLHHFENEQLELVIKKAFRKLKPKGKLIVIDTFNMENYPLRKYVFNCIEPVYAMISGRNKNAVCAYNHSPTGAFITFMEASGFRLAKQTGDSFSLCYVGDVGF